MRKHLTFCWRQSKRRLKFTLFRIIEYAGPSPFTFMSWAHGARMVTRQPSGPPQSSRIHPGYTGPRRTRVPLPRMSVCSVSDPPPSTSVLPSFLSLPPRTEQAGLSNLWNSPGSSLVGWVTRASTRSRPGTGRLGQWAQGTGNLHLRPRETESGPRHWSCRFGLLHKITSEGNDLRMLMPPGTVCVLGGPNSSVSKGYSAIF